MTERSVVHDCCYGDMWFGLMCGWGVEMEQLGSTQSLMAAKFCNDVKEMLAGEQAGENQLAWCMASWCKKVISGG